MLLNPYDTNIGVHVNTRKLETTLNEFIIKTSDLDKLNYEFKNGENLRLVFITGKNEFETELPVWNHPILFKDFKGMNRIFVDIRQFVKFKETTFYTLNDIVNNRPGFDFTITRTIYMLDLFKSVSNMAMIENGLSLSFSTWISSSFKSVLTLGIEESMKIEIIALHYILCVIADIEQDDDSIENIYFKISKNLKSMRGNIKYVKDVCSELNHNPRDAVDLVENISKGVNSPLLTNINTGLLYNIIGNTWNGINASENIAMSFDHVPTLIALIFVSANNKSFKHSRLANVLNSNKRAIKLDDLSKKIELTIKDYTV